MCIQLKYIMNLRMAYISQPSTSMDAQEQKYQHHVQRKAPKKLRTTSIRFERWTDLWKPACNICQTIVEEKKKNLPE